MRIEEGETRSPPVEEDDTSPGVVETRYFRFAERESDRLLLDSGRRFGPVTVAFETYGRLNRDASNAVLVCHALSGDAHAAGYRDRKGNDPGWWNDAIGPGKAFDTDRYFVICSNVIGGCRGTTGPSTIDPETDQAYGLDFPVVTIGDMVEVQKRLLGYLGIEKLLAVAGGSMGGMQAIEWALRYPDASRAHIVIASTARLSPQSIAFNTVGRSAILSDSDFLAGRYYDSTIPYRGLSLARMIGHITYLSDESMETKFGRRLQEGENFSYDFKSEFQVESYLNYQGSKFVERFDANTYLYVTKAMDYFDVARYYGGGSLEKAMERVKSRVLLLSFSSDWLFPTAQSRDVVKALSRLRKDVTWVDIPSSYGHDAFLLEMETESEIIRAFLSATESWEAAP
jgi:homoserine O-acetyltransferase